MCGPRWDESLGQGVGALGVDPVHCGLVLQALDVLLPEGLPVGETLTVSHSMPHGAEATIPSREPGKRRSPVVSAPRRNGSASDTVSWPVTRSMRTPPSAITIREEGHRPLSAILDCIAHAAHTAAPQA